MRKIIYSSRVREYIGSMEELKWQQMRVAIRQPEACMRFLWRLPSTNEWVLQVWTARPEEYTRSG